MTEIKAEYVGLRAIDEHAREVLEPWAQEQHFNSRVFDRWINHRFRGVHKKNLKEKDWMMEGKEVPDELVTKINELAEAHYYKVKAKLKAYKLDMEAKKGKKIKVESI